MKKLFLLLISCVSIGQSFAQIDLDHPVFNRDQIFLDDLIVEGSGCFGFDCVNGEVFGFITLMLKENNTRIKFNDTSVGNFAGNDWTLEANSSDNGGTNHFAIIDDTGAKVPFKIMAGAPTNSLFVNNQGNVGLGTSSPVVELHQVDGDSPTLRLEQNGSGGFTAQTWDVAGNETNFFIRDVTNASQIPFKITPGAPHDMIVINGFSDRVGIGTSSPETFFHVRRPAVNGAAEELAEFDINQNLGSSLKIKNASSTNGEYAPMIEGTTDHSRSGLTLQAVVNDHVPSTEAAIHLTAMTLDTNSLNRPVTDRPVFNVSNMGVSLFQLEPDGSFSLDGNTFYVDGTNNRVGINTTDPQYQLQVNGNIGLTGRMFGVSDARLKKDIKSIDDAMTLLKAIDGKSYAFRTDEYNGLDLPIGRQYGFVAQDVEEVLPDIVLQGYQTVTKDGAESVMMKGIDYQALIPIMVNALKEQEKEIHTLRLQQLELIKRLEKLESTEK